ncbi:MAG: BTAD domain-containing putative transcriptional regulator [Gemmatimonadaceae bacterium]
MSLRLDVFGGLSLSGSAPSGFAHQRRRLALFAVLAASADRGVSRDQLQAFFWPESAPDAARHALEQLLYSMRRALGESIFVGINPLNVNPSVLSSDIADFHAALERSAFEKAVALYTGPFLNGFFLTDAPEFERWVERERTRLSGSYRAALERLAAQAEVAGDPSCAVEWCRRLANEDMLSSRTALRLMRALAAAGDRAAALQHARVYETLVRQELEIAPDSEIVAYLEELRSSNGAAASPPPMRPSRVELTEQLPAAVPSTVGDATPIVVPTIQVAAVGPPSLPGTSKPPERSGSRRVMLVLAVLVPLVVAASWVAWTTRGGPDVQVARDDPTLVFVAPFRVSAADTSLRYLGEAMVDLLSAKFAGQGGPRAIDARTAISAWRRVAAQSTASADDDLRAARGAGAGRVLRGSVVGTGGGRITIDARLLSVADGSRLASTIVEGPHDSLGAVVDRLAARLIALASGVAEQHLGSLTTSSFPALAAYLAGSAAHRRGDDAAALDHFRRALDFDSTFALAALELASARGWALALMPRENSPGDAVMGALDRRQQTLGDDELFDRAMAIAWREKARLSTRDQALLDALGGGEWRRPVSASAALQRWELAAAMAPDRAETRHRMGYLLLYQGLALGLSTARARAALEFRRAAALDSGFTAPLAGLIDVAAFDRDSGTVAHVGGLYLARDSSGPISNYVRWQVAAVTQDESALVRLRTRMESFDGVALDRIQFASQMTGLELGDAARAMDLLVSRSSETLERRIALWSAHWLALNRGRPSEAHRLLRIKRELEIDDGLLWHFSLLGALFGDGDTSAATNAVRGLTRRVDPWLARLSASAPQLETLGPRSPRDTFRQPAFLLTLWRLMHGDSSGAASVLRLMRQAQDERDIVLDALLAALLDRPDAATIRTRLDSLARAGCCAPTRWVNLVLARLHEQAGDDAAALRALRRGQWFFPPWFLATYLREEGRLAARTGDRTGAIRAYRHYLALRSDPEPRLRAQADSVRREVVRLETAK